MEWNVIITLISVISGVILGWTGRAKSNKRETSQDAAAGAKLEQKVDYIKEKVDAIQVDIKDQGEKVDGLAERITRVEESAKSAHHRIDELLKERVS